MSSDWEEYRFGELCDISRGASPRPINEFMSDTGMPWVKIADATASDSKFIERTKERIKLDGASKSVKVFPGDLILTNSATPGLPRFMSIEACIHDGWMLLRNFRGLDKEFAFWLLMHERKNLVAQGNGSVFTNLKTDILRNHTVSIPSLEQQSVIAKILNSLSDKIQLNHQINQTLEQMAQAIFKSWFVDFEPTRAKIAALEAGGSEDDALLAAMQAIAGSALFATDVADADAPTQLARLQADHPEQYATLRATAELFPSAMQESELGEIPEGWSVGTLADFSDLNKNSWTAKTIPEEIDYVDLANTKNGVIECTTRYLSGDAPSRARRKLFNGDTIIGTVRPGNRSFAFIKQPSSSLTGSTGFAVLSPKSPEFAEYIYIAATSDAAINHLAHLADGGAYPAVRSEVVAGITVIVPKSSVLMCFHEMVRPYFDISASLKTENKSLSELRDILLPKLLSGELSLADLGSSDD